MPKNNKTARRSEVKPTPVPISMLGRSTDDKIAAPPVPKDLHDLLEYLEGYVDDEGRFDATHLWPWRNLTLKRRNLNERILRVVLKRLLAPRALLKQHWRRLHADVQEHRRRHKANGKLATAGAAGMVLNAVVDALLPVREVPAKEMASTMRKTARAAEELISCLALLRNTGMNIEELLPTEKTIHHDVDENGAGEPADGYADARFFIHMKLRHSLTPDQGVDITNYALRVITGDPMVTLAILGKIAQAARAYKLKRHNLSGRQRFAYVMATHMVRHSLKFFGAPRYERAEAFTKAASGIQVKGLRQVMERENKKAATEGSKRRRASLQGN